jgi:hypothetical protein
MTFTQHLAAARLDYGCELASIHSEEENMEVLNALKLLDSEKNLFWIGGKRPNTGVDGTDTSSDTWHWTDGSDWSDTYSNFKDGKPAGTDISTRITMNKKGEWVDLAPNRSDGLGAVYKCCIEYACTATDFPPNEVDKIN